MAAVTWQVLHEMRGIEYWWDYPPDVAAELEKRDKNVQV